MNTLFHLSLAWILIVIVYSLREIPELTVNTKVAGENEEYQYKVAIPPLHTEKENSYICYSKSLSELGESFVTKFLTEPNMEVNPHHIDSGLCLDPQHEDTTWECNRGSACRGDAVDFSVTDDFTKDRRALYQLPKDYSTQINVGRKPHFLIVMTHLSKILLEPSSPGNITITFQKRTTKYSYQKFTLSNTGVVPANQNSGFFTHVGCEWRRPKVVVFDYYVHTHSHGLFGEGFLIRNNSVMYLGGQMTKRRPKVLFDIVNGPVEILPGDILAARCLFVNHENRTLELGSEDTCIFELSVGYERRHHNLFARPAACLSHSPEFTFCSNSATSVLC